MLKRGINIFLLGFMKTLAQIFPFFFILTSEYYKSFLYLFLDNGPFIIIENIDYYFVALQISSMFLVSKRQQNIDKLHFLDRECACTRFSLFARTRARSIFLTSTWSDVPWKWSNWANLHRQTDGKRCFLRGSTSKNHIFFKL